MDIGRSCKACRAVLSSLTSGNKEFFDRAFVYAGDCNARRARLTVVHAVSQALFLHYFLRTFEHIFPLTIQDTGSGLEILSA